MRCDAAEILGLIGPAAKDAIPELREALKNSDSYFRLFAADALSQILGPEARDALPALEYADREDIGVLSLLARRSRRRITGWRDEYAYELLWELTTGGGGEVVRTLAGSEASADVAVPIYEIALRDAHATVRKAAAKALGELGPAARSAVRALQKATVDEDREVRRAAEEALGKVQAAGIK